MPDAALEAPARARLTMPLAEEFPDAPGAFVVGVGPARGRGEGPGHTYRPPKGRRHIEAGLPVNPR